MDLFNGSHNGTTRLQRGNFPKMIGAAMVEEKIMI